MSRMPEFNAWLVEGTWGGNETVYLAPLNTSGRSYFGWTREVHRALKFSDWDSAHYAITLAGDQVRVVHGCKTMIAEHRFRGYGGAGNPCEYIERTGRTQ